MCYEQLYATTSFTKIEDRRHDEDAILSPFLCYKYVLNGNIVTYQFTFSSLSIVYVRDILSKCNCVLHVLDVLDVLECS